MSGIVGNEFVPQCSRSPVYCQSSFSFPAHIVSVLQEIYRNLSKSTSWPRVDIKHHCTMKLLLIEELFTSFEFKTTWQYSRLSILSWFAFKLNPFCGPGPQCINESCSVDPGSQTKYDNNALLMLNAEGLNSSQFHSDSTLFIQIKIFYRKGFPVKAF